MLNWGGPLGRRARGAGARALDRAIKPLPGPEPALTPVEAFFKWLDGDEKIAAYVQHAINDPHVTQAAQSLLNKLQQYSDQVADETAYPQVAPSPVPPADQAQIREEGTPFMPSLSLEPAAAGSPAPTRINPRAFGYYGGEKALENDEKQHTFAETEVPKTGLTLAELDSLPLHKRIVMHLASMTMDAHPQCLQRVKAFTP